MEIITVIGLAVVLLGIGIIGLAVRILFVKKGEFPNIHIGANKHLKKKGIHCATTQDKIAQAQVRKELQFKKLQFGAAIDEAVK